MTNKNDHHTTYSWVLFQEGKKLGLLDLFYEQAQQMLKILSNENRLLDFFNKYDVTQNEKHSLVDALFKDKIHHFILCWFYVVVDAHQARYIIKTLKVFCNLCAEHFSIAYVKVFSASPLEQKQLEKIKKALENKLQQHVNLFNIIDESMIGGIKVTSKKFSIDNSFKHKLNTLRNFKK